VSHYNSTILYYIDDTFSRSNNAELMKAKAELEEEIEVLKM